MLSFAFVWYFFLAWNFEQGVELEFFPQFRDCRYPCVLLTSSYFLEAGERVRMLSDSFYFGLRVYELAFFCLTLHCRVRDLTLR